MIEPSTVARHITTQSGTASQQKTLHMEAGKVTFRAAENDTVCVDVGVVADASELVGKDRETHPESVSDSRPTVLPEVISTEMFSALCTGISRSLGVPIGRVENTAEDPSDPFLRCQWVDNPLGMYERQGTIMGYFTSSIPDVNSAKTTIQEAGCCCPGCNDDVTVYGGLDALCWTCPHCPSSGMGFSTTAEMADAISQYPGARR